MNLIHPITINGNTLASGEPTALGFIPPAVNAETTNYIIIQTKTKVLQDDDYIKLDHLGVELLQLVSDQTYLCGYKGTNLDDIRQQDDLVAFVDTYKDNFVIAPPLKERAQRAGPHGLFMQAETGNVTQDQGLAEVDIVLHLNAASSEGTVKSQIIEVTGVDRSAVRITNKRLRATLPLSSLPNIAKIDQVQAILPVHTVKKFNDQAREILHLDFDTNGTSYKGEGQIVCVADTGFDLGDVNNVPDPFGNRLIKLYSVGRKGEGGDLADDPDGHGTHVCGSAVGDGTYWDRRTGRNVRVEAPASRAGLIVQSLITAEGGLSPGQLTALLDTAYSNGARVHTNSWGANIPAIPYAESTAPKELDDFVYKHRDLVVCFAAGNDGVDRTADSQPSGIGRSDGIVDLGQVGAEAIAKNVITVGASESERTSIQWSYQTWGELNSNKFPMAPLRTDHVANSREDMAAFSSRGPARPDRSQTRHFRIKPDVVAPGTAILSTKSRHKNVRPVNWGPSPDQHWMWDFGTSMACPLVAGCCAVIRQFLEQSGNSTIAQKNNRPAPTAALVKAMLINGAEPLLTEAATPNFASGFGRVNLKNSIGPSESAQISDFIEGEPLRTGEEAKAVSVVIPANVAPTTLKVTLVWTDRPGPLLVSDLDLIVRAGSEERHGNVLDHSTFDRINNVEQVTWKSPPAGTLEIVVRAHDVPRLSGINAQDYALVWKLFP